MDKKFNTKPLSELREDKYNRFSIVRKTGKELETLRLENPITLTEFTEKFTFDAGKLGRVFAYGEDNLNLGRYKSVIIPEREVVEITGWFQQLE